MKQLRGGRNVDAVFRQLMIVCQSYGFSLPPPPTKDATLRSTVSLQPGTLEVHELISQIYTRYAYGVKVGSRNVLTNKLNNFERLKCLTKILDTEGLLSSQY